LRKEEPIAVSSPAHQGLRAEIVEVGRRLYDKGLITAAEGNVSVRVEGGLLVTAGGVSKGFLTPELVVETSEDGRGPEGGPRVSSEIAMHVAIYRRRPEVRAIVHAHPPAATAFAVAHLPLDQPLLAECVLLLGPVPLVPYAPPSTRDLADAVGAAFFEANAVLLANHGAVAVGETLSRAHQRMETLEHLARITLLTRLLGQATPLSPEDVEGLLRLTGAPYR
jgi:L-fuculose-phosphate aldolase